MSDLRLERKIVLLAALIQLASILDFMIIMPLGPNLALALNIPSSDMGILAGIYTFAAALSGILIAPYLDRYDRKNAAIFFLSGLVVSTFLCTFAWDTYSMLAARTLAGIFGGPAMALSLAMVIDLVPVERRGRAIAIVTSAFTVSSVFGIPLALYFSEWFDWKMPFLIISILCALIVLGIFKFLPPMVSHIDTTLKVPQKISLMSLLRKREIQLSYGLLSLLSFAQFMLFAGSINYFVFNLDFPREDLGYIYLVGGVLSFAVMMMTGRVVDQYGARKLSFCVTIIYVFVLADGFTHTPYMPVPVIFSLFMMCAAIMGVICTTIASEAPGDKERAAYMSLQSTSRHLAAGTGGVFASLILTSNIDNSLNNVEYLGALSIGCIVVLPLIIIILRRELNKKQMA